MRQFLHGVMLVAAVIPMCVNGGEKINPTEGRPSHTAKELVEALAANDVGKAKSLFVSEAKVKNSVGLKKADYEKFLKRFTDSLESFTKQKKPLNKMVFVRIDFHFCKEPIALSKGSHPGGAQRTEDIVQYDNLYVIVKVDNQEMSFKLGSLIAEGGRWSISSPIGLLTEKK